MRSFWEEPFDRAAHRRSEPDALAGLVAQPDTIVLPVWRNRNLLTDDMQPVHLLAPEAQGLLTAARSIAFLGMAGASAVVMVDLPRGEQPSVSEGAFHDVRMVGMHLQPLAFRLLSYARAMATFHGSQRFDEKTGQPTVVVDAGFARQVEGSDERVFPRTDPAVMVLLTRGDSCLLARGSRFPPTMYSALAGFVEPGETLEECVVREALEEVGIRARAPRYVASQAWPFPRSLMIGFVAEAESETFTPDGEEIVEARWCTRQQLASPDGFFFPPSFSLAHTLITRFRDGNL